MQSERVVPHGLHHTVARHTGEVQRVFHQSIYTCTILHLLVMEGSFGFVSLKFLLASPDLFPHATHGQKIVAFSELHAVDIADVN